MYSSLLMDTTTVLEIIKMIDNKITSMVEDELYIADDMSIGKELALTELRDHLQSFIEGELNKAEQ